MNSKRVISTFGVVLIILTAIVLVGCANTADEPTEDWLTYKNETHGYFFSYPADCTFGAMPGYCKENPPEERPDECLCILNGENPDDVRFDKFTGEVANLSGAALSVSHYDTPVYNPPPGTDLIVWLEENWIGMFESIPDKLNTEIGGIPAVEIYTPQSPMAFSSTTIFFILDGKLFMIHMNDVDNEDNQEVYDQILESFSFEE